MSRHSEALAGLLTRDPLPGIIAAAAEHEAPVLCVGGAIRDTLLARPAADIDLAVGGDLEAFVDLFARHCGRRPVAIGDAWRDTRRTKLGDTQVDVGAMLGGENDDLAARDFTINAMAVRLGSGDGPLDPRRPQLLDPHRGAADLETRTIRMLSPDALAEDRLRMLRAVRYVAVLDGFAIDEATLAAITAAAAAIDAVAAERVQAEWAHLLAGCRWVEASRLVYELDLGRRTLGFAPDLAAAAAWSRFETEQDADIDATDVPALRLASVLAGLPSASVDAACASLVERRWPHRLAQRATQISGWALALADDAPILAWVLEDRVSAADAGLLGRALVPSPEAARRARIEQLETYVARAGEEPWVRGSDLRTWGMEEGLDLGKLLQQACRGQLERRWASAAGARSWAQQRVAEVSLGGDG